MAGRGGREEHAASGIGKASGMKASATGPESEGKEIIIREGKDAGFDISTVAR
jgi:hypothetical protein